MSFLLNPSLGNEIQSIGMIMLIINAILHVIFAGAVARDAGQLHKQARHTYLVSSMTWAFATLVGGVWIAAIYWFMHHVNWSRRGH